MPDWKNYFDEIKLHPYQRLKFLDIVKKCMEEHRWPQNLKATTCKNVYLDLLLELLKVVCYTLAGWLKVFGICSKIELSSKKISLCIVRKKPDA